LTLYRPLQADLAAWFGIGSFSAKLSAGWRIFARTDEI